MIINEYVSIIILYNLSLNFDMQFDLPLLNFFFIFSCIKFENVSGYLISLNVYIILI
jgi:hypothetical protein